MTKYVMVCPKCKSPDIYRDTSNKLTGAMGLPSMYVCNVCGHSGPVFPEVDINELDNFEKEVDKKGLRDTTKDNSELIDTSYGKGIVRGYWKVIGPLAIIFGLVFLLTPFNIYGGFLLLIGGLMTFFSFRKYGK